MLTTPIKPQAGVQIPVGQPFSLLAHGPVVGRRDYAHGVTLHGFKVKPCVKTRGTRVLACAPTNFQ